MEESNPVNSERLTVVRAAADVPCHPATVQKAVRRGELKAEWRLNRYEILRSELNRWKQSRSERRSS